MSAAEGPTPVTSSDTPAGVDPEVFWMRGIYQGDSSRQLTVRAVLAGMLLGGVMSLSNLYIALKTGWSFGVTITAGILAYVIFGVLKKLRIVRTEFGMLENNAMQSVASAAGYMTGGGTVAAIPALMLHTHQPIGAWVIFTWITTIAMLGVFMAIPMKRQMINQEGLKFPSGIAAAETLRGLHPEEARAMDHRRARAVAEFAAERVGDGPMREATVTPDAHVDADQSVAGKALVWAGGIGALVTWLREAHAVELHPVELMTWESPLHFKARLAGHALGWFFGKLTFFSRIPAEITFPGTWHGVPLEKWSLSFDTSLLLFAAGGIMGWRSAWSMALGSVINYGFLAPYGHSLHAIPDPVTYKAIVKWTVWFGSSLLLTSGLLSFAFSWRQVARAFSGLGAIFGARSTTQDPLSEVEVPTSWFLGGTLVLTPLVAFLGWYNFGIAWWMSLICIVLSFFIAIVACRATGETDTTPTGALGKITQIVFGILAPGSVTTNLMSASMSAGVAIHSADMLTDLKSGYLLGARPRQQFMAQFFGVLAGSAFVVPGFRFFVPNESVLGSREVPAPAAFAWHSVAQVLAGGIGQLPLSARYLVAAGAFTGIVMVLIERALPKYKKYIPSAVGFGLAFTLPAYNTMSMFLGALMALMLEHYRKSVADRYIVPVSSGIIAGESLIGIAIKVMIAFSILRAPH